MPDPRTYPDVTNPYESPLEMRKRIRRILIDEGQKKLMPIDEETAEEYLTAMEESFLSGIVDDPKFPDKLVAVWGDNWTAANQSLLAKEILYEDLLIFYSDPLYSEFMYQEYINSLEIQQEQAKAGLVEALTPYEETFLDADYTAGRSRAKNVFMQDERINTNMNSVNAYHSLGARFTKTTGVQRDAVADWINTLTDLSGIDDEAYNNLLDTLVKDVKPKFIRSNDVRRQQGLADQTFSEYTIAQNEAHTEIMRGHGIQLVDPSLMEGFDPMSEPMRDAIQIRSRLPAWIQPHVHEAMGIGPEVLTAIDEAELKAEADPWATMYIALQSMGKLEGLTEQDRRLLIERTQREAESRHLAKNALLQAQGQRPISFEESVMQDIEAGRITGEIPPPTRIGPDG